MKTYLCGKKIQKEKIGCIVITTLLLFVFYFVYRKLFAHAAPRFVGLPLVILFILLDVAFAVFYNKIEGKRAENLFYTTDQNKLSFHNGKTTTEWFWDSFTAARLTDNYLETRSPVQFEYQGTVLKLNSYVDDLNGLMRDILDHISDKLKISEEVFKIL